jgi:hypothetical protein
MKGFLNVVKTWGLAYLIIFSELDGVNIVGIPLHPYLWSWCCLGYMLVFHTLLWLHPCSPSHFYATQGGVTRTNEECCPCHHHGLGASELIRAIGAPLGDYFWGIFLEYFQKSL